MVDIIKFRYSIEKELSKVTRRETRSFLYVTNSNGDNSLKNWDPSHQHKFVTKTRDKPEPGSFFPRFLLGGEMKDSWNEVESFLFLRVKKGSAGRVLYTMRVKYNLVHQSAKKGCCFCFN